VDHQPEPTLLVGLQLDEMVAAPQRRELDRAGFATDRFQAYG
jgi:hypothetical protein